MKCNICRNLCKRRDDDGTLYDWCGMVIDCPDSDIERDCKYYQAATNGDKIRAMSEDELAMWAAHIAMCTWCPAKNINTASPCKGFYSECKANWIAWLKQEAQ